MDYLQLNIFHISDLNRLSHLVLVSFSSQTVFLTCPVLVLMEPQLPVGVDHLATVSAAVQEGVIRVKSVFKDE